MHNKSYVWKEARHLKLTTNMRVHLHGDREEGVFAEMLNSVAEWLARRTRDLEVAGSIPDQAML